MRPVLPRTPARRRPTTRSWLATLALGAAAAAALSVGVPVAAAASRSPELGHALAPNTRFLVPTPADGSLQQIRQLLRSDQGNDAQLIAAMESVPQAVWLDGETQAQAADGSAGVQQANRDVFRQVRQTLHRARRQDAVPVFVAYNIPGRDCSQFSAGGAPSDAAYDSWINSIGQALGDAKAVLLLEPDALANLPGYCGAAYNTQFPNITDTTRIDDVAYGVTTLEQDPNISLYLDGGHSAWQSPGNIAEVLTAADVQQAQGFFLDVSNYQYATNNAFYGVWVSSCITYATQLQGVTQAAALTDASTLVSSDNSPTGAFNTCGPGEYYNGGPANNFNAPSTYNGTSLDPFGHPWAENPSDGDYDTTGPDSFYANILGSTPPSIHFVIDTSRDGLGPNSMSSYAAAPFDQPSSITSGLQSGNWCNPPGSGLGTRPTANTGGILNSLDSFLPADTNLLDAYLWVKLPGQSDGQCDLAGGVRNWQNFTAAGAGGGDTPAIAGWPASTAAVFSTFDPLWSLQEGSVVTDPAAGAWFPAQALQLAQNANPRLGG